MAAPFVRRPTDDGTSGTREDIIKSLDMGKGKARDAVLARKKDGIGLLHAAACQGHLTVCKFLMEELGVYQCAVYHICLTPFMACAESGDVPTVKYFLDHGGDVTKSDDKGCTQFSTMLLAQIPLNIQFILIYITNCIVPNVIANNGACSTLISALDCCSLKCMKLLIKASAGADVNNKGTGITPLMFAALQGCYTYFINILLETGAIPNIPNVDQHQESRKAILKSHADLAFRQKNYDCAAKTRGPTAVLYANKSICRLLMGDGEGALSDGDAE
uniref:Uncharacterized protein n=1 Tax=Oryza nivara TaxID=4536 RepID=A0A0E0FHE4_ORYNI